MSSGGTPSTNMQTSAQSYVGEYVFSLESDVKDQLLKQIDQLRSEIHKLKSEKHDLIRQHMAQQKEMKALKEQELQLASDLHTAKQEILSLTERVPKQSSKDDSSVA
ncbi:hypothetical protein BsWGS_26369 [Bradybaena similaris]